jgi:hypothetical protein
VWEDKEGRTLSDQAATLLSDAIYAFFKKYAIAYIWASLLQTIGITMLSKKLSKAMQKVLLFKLKLKMKLTSLKWPWQRGRKGMYY